MQQESEVYKIRAAFER